MTPPTEYQFRGIDMRGAVLVESVGAASSDGPVPGYGCHVIGIVAEGLRNRSHYPITSTWALQLDQAAWLIVAIQRACRIAGIGDELADEIVRITKEANDIERNRRP